MWSPAALVGMDPEIFSRFRRQLSARPSNMHHPKQNGVMHVDCWYFVITTWMGPNSKSSSWHLVRWGKCAGSAVRVLSILFTSVHWRLGRTEFQILDASAVLKHDLWQTQCVFSHAPKEHTESNVLPKNHSMKTPRTSRPIKTLYGSIYMFTAIFAVHSENLRLTSCCFSTNSCDRALDLC